MPYLVKCILLSSNYSTCLSRCINDADGKLKIIGGYVRQAIENEKVDLMSVPHLQVENYTGKPLKGTARIFMAPTNDGMDTYLNFEKQRKLFVEMDKFVVNCKYTSFFFYQILIEN